MFQILSAVYFGCMGLCKCFKESLLLFPSGFSLKYSWNAEPMSFEETPNYDFAKEVLIFGKLKSDLAIEWRSDSILKDLNFYNILSDINY